MVKQVIKLFVEVADFEFGFEIDLIVVLRGQGLGWGMMGLSVITNILWRAFAGGIFLWVLRSGRRRGMLTKVTSH